MAHGLLAEVRGRTPTRSFCFILSCNWAKWHGVNSVITSHVGSCERRKLYFLLGPVNIIVLHKTLFNLRLLIPLTGGAVKLE